MQTCKNNHQLSLTTDAIGYMAGTFSCDLCHKPFKCMNGRWTCVPCKWDVCPSCATPPPPPSAYIQCGANHPLVWTTDASGYMAGTFSCDICKKAHKAAEGRWSCPACKYDICPHCRAPPPPPVPMMAYLQCGNGDPLVWRADAAGYMAGKFSCDICHKSSNCASGRWSCQAHGYDICQACRPVPDKKCKSGHDLKLSQDPSGYLMGKFSCDICHSSFDCAVGRLTCPCKYDVCPGCMDKA